MRYVTHAPLLTEGCFLGVRARTPLAVAISLLAPSAGFSVALDLLGRGLVELVRPAQQDVAVLNTRPQAAGFQFVERVLIIAVGVKVLRVASWHGPIGPLTVAPHQRAGEDTEGAVAQVVETDAP